MSGLVGGSIVGGLLGGVGGIIEGAEKKRFSKKQRRRTRKGLRRGRAGAEDRLLDLLEGETGPDIQTFREGNVFGKDFRVPGPVLEGERTGSLFSQGEDFLASTFGDPASSPLAQDFVKQIRAAQAARGTLFGGAAVNTEASGLAAFSQNLRTQLLPQLQEFTFAPERLRQSITGFETNLAIAEVTGGFAPQQFQPSALLSGIKGGTAGLLGGAQIGAAFDANNLSQQSLDFQRQQAAKQSA